MYTGCRGKGSKWGVVAGMPYFLPGINNEISSYIPISVYGVDMIFNKWFYREYWGSIWMWGFNTVDFCYDYFPFNDMASSWIKPV